MIIKFSRDKSSLNKPQKSQMKHEIALLYANMKYLDIELILQKLSFQKV